MGVFALLFLPMAILIYLLVHDSEGELFDLDELGAIGIISLAVTAQVLWLYIPLEQIV